MRWALPGIDSIYLHLAVTVFQLVFSLAHPPLPLIYLYILCICASHAALNVWGPWSPICLLSHCVNLAVVIKLVLTGAVDKELKLFLELRPFINTKIVMPIVENMPPAQKMVRLRIDMLKGINLGLILITHLVPRHHTW